MASRYHSAMRLDPVSLRLFVAAMEEGAIARAAEREHLAASAASRRLADLEQQMGVALFARSNRGTEPTAAAYALLDLARELATAGRLDGPAVAAILGRHGILADLQTEGHLIVPPYRSHLGDAPD